MARCARQCRRGWWVRYRIRASQSMTSSSGHCRLGTARSLQRKATVHVANIYRMFSMWQRTGDGRVPMCRNQHGVLTVLGTRARVVLFVVGRGLSACTISATFSCREPYQDKRNGLDGQMMLLVVTKGMCVPSRLLACSAFRLSGSSVGARRGCQSVCTSSIQLIW